MDTSVFKENFNIKSIVNKEKTKNIIYFKCDDFYDNKLLNYLIINTLNSIYNACLVDNLVVSKIIINIDINYFSLLARKNLKKQLVIYEYNKISYIENNFLNSLFTVEINFYKKNKDDNLLIIIDNNLITINEYKLIEDFLLNKLKKTMHDILWQDEKNVFLVKDIYTNFIFNYYNIFYNLKYENLLNNNLNRNKIIKYLINNGFNDEIISQNKTLKISVNNDNLDCIINGLKQNGIAYKLSKL